MSIQPISDNQAWAQFLSAANAARARNPVLDPAAMRAAANIKTGQLRGYGTQVSAAQVALGVNRAADAREPAVHREILGTRFDAYA